MSRDGFLERTLASVAESVERDLVAEEIARRRGLLQALDPRVKVVTFLLLILTANLLSQLHFIVAFYLLTIYFALLGRIPIMYFLKRVWLFIPLFTGIIALPAIFNWVTPGSNLLVLADWEHPVFLGPFRLPDQLSITQQGLRTATTLELRVATSVSLGLLLLLTTRWSSLLRALRYLHLPAAIINILEMTHRYVFLLLRYASDMIIARKSRTLKRFNDSERHRWLASAAGNLLAKSYQISSNVYLAMLSRGYRGNPAAYQSFSVKVGDWVWIGFALSIVSATLWFDRMVT
jgi:cobalt/nickel transport system permease protein